MRRGWLATGIAAMLLSTSAARAADPNNVREADRRFHEGVRLMAAGKADEARVRFAEANALVRSTDILWNLIAAEIQSAHYADALNHARQFVRDPKAPPNEISDTNLKAIPIATKWVGQIEIEAPSGAQVEIDSKEKAGHAPLLDPYAVAPGTHQVVALAGAERWAKDVDVAAGQVIHVVLGAASSPAPSPPPQPPVGETPPSAPPADPVAVSAAAPARPAPETPPSDTSDESRTRMEVTLSFGAGAVVLGAASIVLLSMAESNKSSASSLQASLAPGACPSAGGCADLSNDLHSQNTDFRVGEVLLVGTAVAAAGAALSWVLLRPREHASGVQSLVVLPAGGSSARGLAIQGSF